jgi:hypothetical protein
MPKLFTHPLALTDFWGSAALAAQSATEQSDCSPRGTSESAQLRSYESGDDFTSVIPKLEQGNSNEECNCIRATVCTWLFLRVPSCVKECTPEPGRFGLAGSVNRARNFFSLLRRQANGKHNGGTFGRKPRPSHFSFHNISDFCIRKVLTKAWGFVYKSKASSNEANPFQQSARTSLERLMTRDTRLSPGRAVKRLAMQTQSYQAGISAQKTRSLKIEVSGDFFKRSVTPKIRLAGKWLENAGFKPGHRVQVIIGAPGVLSIHVVQQGSEAGR